MRTLLIVMTAVVLVIPFTQMLGWRYAYGMLVVVLILLPAISLGACAAYCRGSRQTFFIGALAGAIFLWLSDMASTFYRDLAGIALHAVTQILICVVSGLTALATRRFIERRGWNQPDAREENEPPQ